MVKINWSFIISSNHYNYFVLGSIVVDFINNTIQSYPIQCIAADGDLLQGGTQDEGLGKQNSSLDDSDEVNLMPGATSVYMCISN